MLWSLDVVLGLGWPTQLKLGKPNPPILLLLPNPCAERIPNFIFKVVTHTVILFIVILIMIDKNLDRLHPLYFKMYITSAFSNT